MFCQKNKKVARSHTAFGVKENQLGFSRYQKYAGERGVKRVTGIK